MGLLQPLHIAKGHWERIGIDFITTQPILGNVHNCIVTFVDHIPKRPHCAACRKTIDASAFARIFIEDIVCLDRVPEEVVSDRNEHFTADYRSEVAKILQTRLLMSTALHPDMDGLSEISNKIVVRYLHGFATHNQANWDNYLPLVEYVDNSSVNHSTKRTPFELDLGFEPPSSQDSIAVLQRPQANESARTLHGSTFAERSQRILGVTSDEQHDAQDKQPAEADKSRRPIDPAIIGRVKVCLDTQDLATTYANVNPTQCILVHRYIGPYQIL